MITESGEYSEHRLAVARTARVGRQGILSEATTDLWIVLHGYGQLAGPFAASATWPAAPHRAFLYPEALQRFYDAEPGASHADARVGASWMTRESRDDDIADNLSYLTSVVTDAARIAPHAAVTVLGFSQGGATAARWVAAQLQSQRNGHSAVTVTLPIARLILWGSALPLDVDIGATSALRSVPVHIVHGTRDRWVTKERVTAERARLEGARFPVTSHEYIGGHRLDDAMLRTLS